MPVPFPTQETVNLVPPDAEEAQRNAEGMASVVAGREGLLPIQRALLESLSESMTGHAVVISERPSLTPAAVAQSMARRDRQFRSRMVQVALLAALVRHPLPQDIADSVAELARELGVEEGMVKVASDFAAGSLGLARMDFERNGYTGTWEVDEVATSAATHASRPLDSPWDLDVADPALAARWAALEALPADTIGRKVWEMYQARGFTFPGLPGSAPPLLCQHDWVHVLADFGTTVESEVEVFGFIARANDDLHAFSLLAMVISLFETGYLADGAGLFQSSPGHFSNSPGMAVRLSDAMTRGARCHDRETGSDSIDFMKMDWFEVADVTCTALRERFGVVEKSEAARAAGSVGPWEPGGISPFQLNAGRELADARAVPYDAHGASA
jgi:hypothetical protein